MKKFIFLIFFLSSSTCYSQISLDLQTPMFLNTVRLNISQTKYIDEGSIQHQQLNQFSLYNLDGSLFKTIQIPPKPDPSAGVSDIYWISTSLFDNDSSTIEYLIVYYWDSIPGYSFTYHNTRIIREDGTILLDEMNARSSNTSAVNGGPPLIYSTEQGTKLMLYYEYANFTFYQTKVFNLPGEIPTGVQDNLQNNMNNLTLYPNPNNGSFSININAKSGESGVIELYSISGKLLGTFISTGKVAQINTTGLLNGMYLLNAKTSEGCQRTKMIIQK